MRIRNAIKEFMDDPLVGIMLAVVVFMIVTMIVCIVFFLFIDTPAIPGVGRGNVNAEAQP